MPSTSSDAKNVALTTQAEKPIHYTYLKEFRVEQCPLFLQHKCTQHKPFTCFYWHFMNQRRRRPIRRRDGTFNYNPDVYCTKYDETTGVCPAGDDCPYLHRTAGDTERRYHLRYYKTGICVYDTDARGYCVKNGPHCAFAHGIHDLRNPVYDVRELQAMEGAEEGPNGTSGPNNLDKERNALNEDPKWQDTVYVLANYKTEPCKRPPRLCRQGYACPQFHNNRDRRRSPKKYKYRSTPCPNVKQGDEWGDPANCENSDNCPYCHTRTEQQFHPEIYKSTKCNDILQNGYCPRGPFCAFAHVDKEISAIRDLGPDNTTDLAAILSSALPPSVVSTSNSNEYSQSQSSPESNKDNSQNKDQQQTNQDYHMHSVSNSQNTREMDIYSTSSHPLPTPISRPRSYSSSTNHSGDSLPQYPKAPGSEREDKEASIQRQLQLIDNDTTLDPLEKARRKQSVCLSYGLSPGLLTTGQSIKQSMSSLANLFYPVADTVESVVGNALDDLNLDEINVEASLDRDLENETNSINNTSSSGLLGASAPMNIPQSDNRVLSNLSPPVSSPLPHMLHLGPSSLTLPSVGNNPEHSMDKAAAAFYGHSSSFNAKYSGSHFPSSMYDYSGTQNMSPGSRIGSQSSSLVSNMTFNSFNSTSNLSEIQRLREELASNRAKLVAWEEGMSQIRTACEAWKREADEANRRERLAEQQRDEAISKLNALQSEVETISGEQFLHSLARISELETLPLTKLKQLQEQLRSDLDKLDKVVYHQTTSKCMICEEQDRSMAVMPCSHYVLCSQCASQQQTCPSCQAEITQRSNISVSL
ncbi:RING finger protein unkempt isoform X1 [Centruroides vittatus]|uniref:RING finger protein unkempt isoform X1 n=2 Tax=Centruroides vittatus TaxID=120091 RepID=UPI00350E9FB4